MHFDVDKIAVGLFLVGSFFIGLLKKFLFARSPSPSLAYSRVKDLKLPSWRSKWSFLPQKLHFAALFSFIIAFIDPHLLFQKTSLADKQNLSTHGTSTEGLAIYLVLDQSGSMNQSTSAGKKAISKLEMLKRVTNQFVLDHSRDLLGLVAFARVPRVIVPLTLDQETLTNHINQIQTVKNPEEDGTAIGYAIYKTAQLIASTRDYAEQLKKGETLPYKIKSPLMIVVTDGFQDPSRLDQGNRLRTMELDDAATYAKSQNIRVYIINIDPSLNTAQFAPQRRQLQSITTMTGGQYYQISDQTYGLKEIYADIDRLEKGAISKEMQLKSADIAYTRFSLYPFFIALGMFCFAIALLLDSLVLKLVP